MLHHSKLFLEIYKAWKFGMECFGGITFGRGILGFWGGGGGGFVGSSRDFFGLIFTPIGSFLSVEIRCTPPPLPHPGKNT